MNVHHRSRILVRRWGGPLRTATGGQRSLAAGLALACLTACDGRDTSDPFPDLAHYEIGEQPLVILREDGTPEKEFTSVSARRLTTGDIVVADAGSASLHLFARDGQLKATLARRGDGPGELQGMFGLTTLADTILTLGRPPMSRQGVNVYVAERGFVRNIVPATDSVRLLTVMDRLATGQFVVRRGMAIRAFDEPPKPGTMIPDTVVFGLYEVPAGAGPGKATWLTPVQTHSFFVYAAQLGRLQSALAVYQLGPTTTVVASGDRLWVIDGGGGALTAYDGAGLAVVSRRLSLEPEPFDEAALVRARALSLASARTAQDTARFEAMYDRAFLPAMMPLVSAAHPGADGEVWLRLFDVESVNPPRYLVIDRDGNEIATAVMPSGLGVQHIGADFVLVTRRDSLDVQSVVEYPLRR
jgi:hypothetical protein